MRRAVEADDADPHAVRDGLEERRRGRLGRVDPGRAHVRGFHRQRRVDREHDDAALAGDVLGAGRLGEPHRTHHESEEKEECRQMPAPSRTVGRHGVEQVDVGELHCVRAPAALHHEVRDHHRDRDDEKPQAVRRVERE